jgi:hypothetical protein
MTKPILGILTAFVLVGCLLCLAGCGPSVPSTAMVRNLSRPGATDFQVGESFEVVVTGAPNQAVVAAASQNGSPMAISSFGRTDKNGRFTFTGSMAQTHVGSWREQWRVGEIKAPLFSFEVKPAAR